MFHTGNYRLPSSECLMICCVLVGDVEHLYIPLEAQSGNRVSHPKLTINLHGGAKLTPGYMGNAATFNGNRQYMTLGDHPDDCMGNLER